MDNKQATINTSQPAASQPAFEQPKGQAKPSAAQAELPVGCYLVVGWAVIISCCAASIFAVLLATGSVKLGGSGPASDKMQSTAVPSLPESKSGEGIKTALSNKLLFYATGCNYYVYGNTDRQLEKITLPPIDNPKATEGSCAVISEEILEEGATANQIKLVQTGQVVERYRYFNQAANNYSWYYYLVDLKMATRQVIPLSDKTDLAIITIPRKIGTQYRTYAVATATSAAVAKQVAEPTDPYAWDEIIQFSWSDGSKAAATRQIVYSKNTPETTTGLITQLSTDASGDHLVVAHGVNVNSIITVFNDVSKIVLGDGTAAGKLARGFEIKGRKPVWLKPATSSDPSAPAEIAYFMTNNGSAGSENVGSGSDDSYKLVKYNTATGQILRLASLPAGKTPTNLIWIDENRLSYSLQDSQGKITSYELLPGSETFRDLGELDYAASYEGDIIGIALLKDDPTRKYKVIRQTGSDRLELLRF